MSIPPAIMGKRKRRARGEEGKRKYEQGEVDFQEPRGRSKRGIICSQEPFGTVRRTVRLKLDKSSHLGKDYF
jgi:hypothetical protein